MAVVTALVRTIWSGTTGGPGLTQFAIEGITDPHSWNATSAQQAVDATRTLWNSMTNQLPDNIKLDVSPVVDIYNIQSGDLVNSYSAGTIPAQVVGINTTPFMMAGGIKVALNTGVIRNGRRVRGSVFIVPAASGSFTTDGDVISTVRTAINGYFGTYKTALAANNMQLTVWSRPLGADKPRGPRDGVTTPVISASTNSKGAILRGRRD